MTMGGSQHVVHWQAPETFLPINEPRGAFRCIKKESHPLARRRIQKKFADERLSCAFFHSSLRAQNDGSLAAN